MDTVELFEDFLYKVLKTEYGVECIAEKLIQVEMSLANFEGKPTITHKDYRTREYRDSAKREELRNQILAELIEYERIDCDDDIRLGLGGAKPKEPKAEQVAYIVSGAPASGKSSISDELSSRAGAYILDSDYAKRKIPEYAKYDGGASLVHEESSKIVFGNKDSLLEYCIYSKYNLVIPLVGRTQESVESIRERLSKAGYKIHFINVALDRYDCTCRAYQRFLDSNRYVPLSYVFDEVGNEPELVYFRLRRESSTKYESFSQLSTKVARGEKPIILEASENSPYRLTGGK